MRSGKRHGHRRMVSNREPTGGETSTTTSRGDRPEQEIGPAVSGPDGKGFEVLEHGQGAAVGDMGGDPVPDRSLTSPTPARSPAGNATGQTAVLIRSQSPAAAALACQSASSAGDTRAEAVTVTVRRSAITDGLRRGAGLRGSKGGGATPRQPLPGTPRSVAPKGRLAPGQ